MTYNIRIPPIPIPPITRVAGCYYNYGWLGRVYWGNSLENKGELKS